MNLNKFYINGQWVKPATKATLDVINPATEEVTATIAMGSEADVDKAVAAASAAFGSFAATTVEERTDMLRAIAAGIRGREKELADVIVAEMGSPRGLAQALQAPAGRFHFATAAKILSSYAFEERLETTLVVKEPIGVVSMITPWNWPLNQAAVKIAPAIAVGCTMVLKPSEISPLSALILAEIIQDAGVPPGVFNLVQGDGATVGARMSSHPDVDMVTFTGSTRAGVEVAKNAAPTVKRVAQELGGKSANIILDDANFEHALNRDAFEMCLNTGQSCNAGARILVPASRMDEAADIAARSVESLSLGDPADRATTVGPVVSQGQWDRIQTLIQAGIDEGATLAAGGVGRPEGLDRGYFVKPTVFSHVTNDMRIAQEEVFGPVVVLIGYDNDDHAVEIANDSPYGLSGYISGSHERAMSVARRIRTGEIHLNGAGPDFDAPFGGYKQSGNGREWGVHGFAEFLETKSILGAIV
ncbi:MAG: aldehyde dehydrogenase family protein [Acidimicrobiales bacterium]